MVEEEEGGREGGRKEKEKAKERGKYFPASLKTRSPLFQSRAKGPKLGIMFLK